MGSNFKRRDILKIGAASFAASSVGFLLLGENVRPTNDDMSKKSTVTEKKKTNIDTVYIENESTVKDSLNKIKHFDTTFSEDVFLDKNKQLVFQSTLKRIQRVKKTIGFANFNLISFDDMLLYAHRFPKIGKFSKAELVLIDEIFFFDANAYGFYGNKVIKELTSTINKKETIKIHGSGHYLFQGDALTKFKQLEKDIGSELVLTSGVRSIVKQLQLFLSKLDVSNGNLSLASRSLAPPGHSYHGIGDFDVGKKGFGQFNFTAEFAQTKEYKKLIELKYVDLRYTKTNKVGVRYEPWHIKVV